MSASSNATACAGLGGLDVADAANGTAFGTLCNGAQGPVGPQGPPGNATSFDSGWIAVGYQTGFTLPHPLGRQPLDVQITLRSTNGRVLPANIGFIGIDGGWHGLILDSNGCTATECDIRIGGQIGTGAYGQFDAVRVMLS